MLIPENETLEAIVNLNKLNNKSWGVVTSWFINSYYTQTAMLVDLEDAQQLAIFAGRCRELKEAVHYLQNAESVLNALPPPGEELQNPQFTPEEAAALLD